MINSRSLPLCVLASVFCFSIGEGQPVSTENDET